MATIGTGNNNGVKLLTSVNDTVFWNIKQTMARKGAALSFGQGVLITAAEGHEDLQDTIDEIREFNNFDELMLQAAEDGNYWGMVITTISKQGDNVLFQSADPELYQEVGVIEVTPVYAKLLIKKVIGANVYYINEFWDAYKVTRSIDVWNPETNGIEKVPTEEVPSELNLPLEEIHGLGFVPFERYLNRPIRNIMATLGGQITRLQDDYEVNQLPIHINNGIRQWYKEEIFGKTRAYTTLTATQLEKLKAAGTDSGLVVDDMIMSVNPGPNASKAVEIAPGTYNDVPWSGSMKSKVNAYAIGCGYSPVFPEVLDPTVAESLISKDLDQRTTQEKKKRYTQFIEKLFAKAIVMLGKATSIKEAKTLFSVEIKENVIYNKMQLGEYIVYARDNGLITNEESIMMHRNLDNEADAKIILDKISKQMEEKATKELEQAQALMQDPNEAPSDPTVPTQDADPKASGGK